MVTSLREVFISFALLGMFVFATISFIVATQTENNLESTILENAVINKTFINLETNLSDFRTQTQTQKESFEGEIPERGFGSLIIFAIVGVGQKFTGLIMTVYNIVIVLPASILGVSPVVIGVMTAILLVSVVLLGWRVYRVGS